MYACLFPEPIHVSLPMNPRFDMLAGDKSINVVFICLAMLRHCLVECYLCPLFNSIIVDVDGMIRIWWLHVMLN